MLVGVAPSSSSRWAFVSKWLPVAAPLLVVCIGAYWTVVGAYRETFAILGRDPGIFQYVAWAIGRGERDYVDVREINGPLSHLIHLVFLHLGGADEHGFRILDIASQASVFALVGALLPGIGRSGDAPGPTSPRWPARTAWAAASVVVLLAQYLVYGWWQTAQRESFYDLFLIASMALQLYAQQPAKGSVRPAALLAVAGALNAATWFGKPTCVSFAAFQALALLVDGDAARSTSVGRRRALAWFGAGCAGACVAMVGLTLAIGDPVAGAHIVFGEVPRLYRWIWKLSLVDCYTIWNNAPKLNYAVVTMALTLGCIALRWLPRRMLVPVSMLAGGTLNFFVQGKGFPYHLHPITLGTHYVWLAAACCAVERASSTAAARARWAVPVVACGMALIGYQSSTEARLSDYVENDWWRAGATSEQRASKAYFDRFPWGDYFPWDMREAARYLDDHTAPDDRVQLYGMDPYLLFLARRLSATPFMYSFELNVDGALQGGSGGVPGPAERAWLLEAAHRHETDLLAALERRPPAAFAFIAHAPFTYPTDAVLDLKQHCPRVAEWMLPKYRETARFGEVTVWMRNDLPE